MVEVMHPVGRGPDGRIIHISEAQRGLASRILCLACGDLFVARQGQHNAWHFAHHNPNPACGGSLMSDAHDYAQQILLDASRLILPATARHGQRLTPYTDPVKEARQIGYVLDILAQVNSQPLGIEVNYSHAVTAAKRALIQAGTMPVVEINITNVDPAVVYDPQRFADYVLHVAPRHWLSAWQWDAAQTLPARMRHAEALRQWHRRESPYDDRSVSAPVLLPEAGEWTNVDATT